MPWGVGFFPRGPFLLLTNEPIPENEAPSEHNFCRISDALPAMQGTQISKLPLPSLIVLTLFPYRTAECVDVTTFSRWEASFPSWKQSIGVAKEHEGGNSWAWPAFLSIVTFHIQCQSVKYVYSYTIDIWCLQLLGSWSSLKSNEPSSMSKQELSSFSLRLVVSRGDKLPSKLQCQMVIRESWRHCLRLGHSSTPRIK